MHQLESTVFLRCVEDSSEAIMITNPEGALVYVNPAWSRIYGYSSKEAIGRTPKLLQSGLQDDRFYREMWAQIRDPKVGSWRGELVNRAKDGTLVPVLLTITGYKAEGRPEILGYMGTAVDLTYRRELEGKIAHQDRLASVGLLASGLAHEIGTPLGVIRGRAELLEMQAEDPGVRRSLGVITSEIDRISKLIRSLLRVSRSSSDVRIEDVAPLEVAREVAALLGKNLIEDCATLTLEIPEDLRARADFGRLEQILLNLVMNAIHAVRKARDSGTERPHFVVIRAREASDQVRIEVQDSGCGIEPKNMGKLFKPFFTTKDVGEGTGLGLAIVATLVREMKGRISVQSTPDVGTTFTLDLPRARS